MWLFPMTEARPSPMSHELWGLPDGLVGIGTTPSPAWVPGIVPSHPLRWFSAWPWGAVPRAHPNQEPGFWRRTLYWSLEFSLCEDLSSLIFCAVNSSCLGASWTLSSVSSTQGAHWAPSGSGSLSMHYVLETLWRSGKWAITGLTFLFPIFLGSPFFVIEYSEHLKAFALYNLSLLFIYLFSRFR